jgi:hypothetical protein
LQSCGGLMVSEFQGKFRNHRTKKLLFEKSLAAELQLIIIFFRRVHL